MEFEKIRRLLSELLKIDPSAITEESFLVDDLGADSLDLFQLIMRLEEEYCVETDDRLLEEIFTVGDVVKALRELTDSGKTPENPVKRGNLKHVTI